MLTGPTTVTGKSQDFQITLQVLYLLCLLPSPHLFVINNKFIRDDKKNHVLKGVRNTKLIKGAQVVEKHGSARGRSAFWHSPLLSSGLNLSTFENILDLEGGWARK